MPISRNSERRLVPDNGAVDFDSDNMPVYIALEVRDGSLQFYIPIIERRINRNISISSSAHTPPEHTINTEDYYLNLYECITSYIQGRDSDSQVEMSELIADNLMYLARKLQRNADKLKEDDNLIREDYLSNRLVSPTRAVERGLVGAPIMPITNSRWANDIHYSPDYGVNDIQANAEIQVRASESLQPIRESISPTPISGRI